MKPARCATACGCRNCRRELTYANNTRVVTVQVQPRALHVLYFTQELGIDYKYLRDELGDRSRRPLHRDVPRARRTSSPCRATAPATRTWPPAFPPATTCCAATIASSSGSFPASDLERRADAGAASASSPTAARWSSSAAISRSDAAATPPASSRRSCRGRSATTNPIWPPGTFPVSVAPSAAAVDFTAGLARGHRRGGRRHARQPQPAGRPAARRRGAAQRGHAPTATNRSWRGSVTARARCSASPPTRCGNGPRRAERCAISTANSGASRCAA